MPEREVEGAEESRQRVGVAGEPLVGHEAQLERGPLRRDGDEEDQRGHQPEVRAGRRSARMASASGSRLGASRPRHGLAGGSGCWRSPRSTAASAISAASTSSRLTAPPTGPTRKRARRPPVIAPSDAPAPIRPNSRLACRVSNSEFAKLHACTGAMIAETVHPDVEDARQQPERMEAERVPEQQDVGAEEQQRRDGDAAGADAGRRRGCRAARTATARAAPRRRRRRARTGRTASRNRPLRIGLASRNEATTTAM